VRLEVRHDVDEDLAELQTSVRLLALAQKSVELAELKLGRDRQVQAGLATLADLVRFQRDLDNALIGLQRCHARCARPLAAVQSQGALHGRWAWT
jgi:outer membrane protein TolC